jgi:hypothetical protein
MKDSLFDALPRPTPQDDAANPVVDRRSFVKFGAATFGVLAGASSAPAFFWRRAPIVPQGPPLIQLPPPLPPGPLAFEASCGVNPDYMVRLLQEYLALTVSPDFARQIVQAQPIQPIQGDFHQYYWSDFRFFGQIPPTRTRYGFYIGVNEMIRCDAQISIRPYQDLNYFEMRRVINITELSTFGSPLIPYNYRRPPVQADMDAFYRVCRSYYGIGNPEAYALSYVRQFTNGRYVFNGYLIARGPDPMRSPFKDLLIDNVPVII